MNKKATYQSVPLKVLLFMAWRNLVSKKLRSFLTIVGIVIGVGAIFFLSSLGLGLQKLVTNEVIGGSSVRTIDVTSPNSKIINLDKNMADKISNLANVEKLGRAYSYASSLQLNGSEIDTITYGIDQNYQDLSDFNILGGRLIKSEDKKVAFINKAALEAVGARKADDIVNKEIDLVIPLRSPTGSQNKKNDNKELKEKLKVVGVIESGSGSEVFVPSYVFSNAGVDIYSQFKLTTKEINKVDELRKRVESLGLETKSPLDMVDQINQMFKYFNVILIGFGSIGMIVAILGMFNTLTITLLERSKEIGLMMALGARNKDMRLLFVYEAMMLSLIGSVIGIGLGLLTARFVDILMNQSAKGRGVADSFTIFATPLWLMILLIGFMSLIGLAVVLMPARRAEKINPIDALRRE